jgi:hypothetical protein
MTNKPFLVCALFAMATDVTTKLIAVNMLSGDGIDLGLSASTSCATRASPSGSGGTHRLVWC